MDTPPSITPLLLLFSFASFFFLSHARFTAHDLRFLSPAAATTRHRKSTAANATNWAVLVAGSNGFGNYRHQADICHAYQILKKGGVKDENIIVFMYDDIAHSDENPKQGVIINSPKGSDVYKGVPKDYTGDDVTASNLLAVILGNKKAVKGGSGKILETGPNDHIFIYYSDHGSPGVLSMPVGDDLYAKDLVDALKKKHAAGTYKRMVIYIEACEAGSIFDGLLPEGMNIYVTTASNPTENSYATYCPDTDPTVPTQYQTCLGDLYSVSWMEDSDKQNPSEETLEAQYQIVKNRTISAKEYGSHVMQYGNAGISKDAVGLYIGNSPNHRYQDQSDDGQDSSDAPLVSVDQHEADIVYLRQKVRRAPDGSKMKAEAQGELEETLAHRKHVDQSFEKIGKLLFGGSEVLNKIRPAGQPLVDDWDCLKSMVETYKRECGSLATYGKKYMRAFANICNAGLQQQQLAQASSRACKITP